MGASAFPDSEPIPPHQDVFIAWYVRPCLCHFRALRSSIGPQPQIKSKPKPTPTPHSIQVSSGYEIFTRAKYLGGDLEDYGASTVADPSDPTAVYSLGTSLSPVFSLNTGPLELLPGTEADGTTHAFLVRLDGPTSRLLWAKSLGPIVPMNGTAPKLAVHGPSKALYVAGASFLSFPPAAGNGQSSTVLRLDTDTGDVVWARNVPQAWALAVQPTTGQPFVAGCVFSCLCLCGHICLLRGRGMMG